MLTTRQKQTLLKLIQSVTIQGPVEQARKTIEELDGLARAVEAIPVKDEQKDEKPGKKK